MKINITNKIEVANSLLLEIYNVKGEKVFWKQIDSEGEQLIDLHKFAAGLYTISLYKNEQLLESKKLHLIK